VSDRRPTDPELIDAELPDPETVDAELLEAELLEGGLPDQAVADEPVGAGRSLLSASAAPAIGTALSRVTGLLRVAALTAALGLTSVADVYNLANTAPNILYELVIGGVLSSTLVPLFIHANDRAAEGRSDDSASVIVTVSFVAITVLSFLAVLVAPLINAVFSLSLDGAEKTRQSAIGDDFLILLLPQVFFYGMMTLGTAVLHAKRRFAAPAFAPVLTNVVISAAALSVYLFIDPANDGPDSMRTVYVLGLGTTAGIAAMAVALLPAVRRSGTVLRWSFQPRHPAIRSVLRLSGWTVGFAVSNQIALLIVLTLARGAGTGAVSAYQYAFIFFQLPYGLIAVSLMTAVLPELATAAANRDHEQFVARFHEGLGLLVTFMLPAAGAYLFIGRPLIALLLQRGEFDVEATMATSDVLAGFSVGLPAFAVFLYCVRAFHARRNTRTPFYLNLFENALNVALVIPLVAVFATPGLAVAYSAAYWVAAAVALVVLNRHVPGLLGWPLLVPLGRSLLVAAAVLVWIGVVTSYVDVTGSLAQVVLCVVVGGAVFVAATLLARPPGFEPIADRAARMLRRRA
jgi:putative peptidoglycan lipid II flippase